MLHFLLSPLYEYNLCYCEVIDTNQNQSKTIHSFTQSWLYYYAVGRSDFHFLRFSKMDTVLSIGFIFISSILKYQQLFSARPRGREFIFLNHRDLKNKFLFWKFINIFLLLQRTNAKKNIWEKFVFSI